MQEDSPQRERVSYMHLDIGGGQATAAFDADTRKEAVIRVGFAFCSPNDQFSRKKGRLISLGRMEKKKFFYEFTVKPDTGMKEIKGRISDILKQGIAERDTRLPHWLVPPT